MTVELLVVLAIVLFIAIALTGAPLAFALTIAGAVGLVLLQDAGQASATLAGLPFASTAKFALVLVPLFVFTGLLMLHGGIAQDLYAVTTRMFRGVRGGVGLATVAACAAFGAVTGSSVATVATIGRISIAEMRAQGYSPELAAGIVAAGGTLGILIPPSVVLVLYGILAEVSIGALLLAGIVPAILSAFIYGVHIYVKARVGTLENLEDALPRVRAGVAAGVGPSDKTPASQRPGASTGDGDSDDRVPYGSLWYIVVLFTVVVGGIYTGTFTAGEAGAMGALVALLMVSVRALRRKLGLRRVLRDALTETTSVTSMTFALLMGGAIFTYFFVLGRIPHQLTTWMVELPVAPVVVMIGLLLVFIPLGMFLDSISMLLITVPLAAPVADALGYDLIWFGIMVVKMIELGLVTPPVGLNVFVVAGVSDEVTVEQAFRGILPFAGLDLLTIAILFVFPSIVTFLPSLAGY